MPRARQPIPAGLWISLWVTQWKTTRNSRNRRVIRVLCHLRYESMNG